MELSKYSHIYLLFIVCFFTFFINNDVLYTDIMESRNIVTAREMVYDGNWIIPTMNGELRLEKPPLPTWIAAIVEYISPDNMGLQRAMAGITATLMVFFLYFWVVDSPVTGNTGLISALILCTSLILYLWDVLPPGIFIAIPLCWELFTACSELLKEKAVNMAGLSEPVFSWGSLS